MTTAWPSIPSWEQTDLENLSSSGQLSGVNPLVLGVIDDEESSGEGGGINPEGYGGFFGLGVNSTYPGGTSTQAMLSDPSEQSFESQAEIAASEFASLLTEYGNPISAEEAYQTGSPSGPTPGSELLQQYLGGGSATSGVPNAASGTDTGLLGGIASITGLPQAVSSIEDWGVKIALVGVGLVLAVLGVWKLANPGKSATDSVTSSLKKAADEGGGSGTATPSGGAGDLGLAAAAA